MLKRKRLVLLTPESWEDKNDTEILSVYKERKGVNKLFVLCFSEGDETIHHWKAFADGISGCCVEFNQQKLIRLIKRTAERTSGIRYRMVKYKKISELKDGQINVEEIPFTKRWPYRCEAEFRIIWEGDTAEDFYEIEFDLSIISKITISQRMPHHVYQTIKNHLRAVCNDPDQRINRSTLYENKRWIEKFKDA